MRQKATLVLYSNPQTIFGPAVVFFFFVAMNQSNKCLKETRQWEIAGGVPILLYMGAAVSVRSVVVSRSQFFFPI